MKPACLVLPGAGTRLGAVAGAVEVLWNHFHFLVFAGTSGGGLVALALASGMSPHDVSDLCTRVLMRTDLLDLGVPLLDGGPAIYRGHKIRELLKEVFGEMAMGQLRYPARIGCSSIWTEKVGLVDSVRHKDVLVRDAAYATMAIEMALDPARIRHDNARTYGDGGAGLNVPAGAWDDEAAQTIVIRFKEQQPVHTIASLLRAMDGDADADVVHSVRTAPELAAASFGICMGAASAAFPSKKADTVEVVITSDADGLKFGISREECLRRRLHGVTSAQKWVGVLA